MVAEAFFHNPDFLRYARLLAQLHLAMKEGWDETADGEALREQMDEPGSRLSREEGTSLNGISADLHSLADAPAAQVLPMTANVMADLDVALQARKSQDFNKALEVLRNYAAYVPLASLAYLRGRIWLEAGEHSIAGMFLERASELDPGNANYRYLSLHSLSLADPALAAESARVILANPEVNPPALVIKAADILFGQSRKHAVHPSQDELDSLIPIVRRSVFRMEALGEGETRPELLGTAHAIIDYCSRA
jgi:hypothetical protein